MSLYNDITFAEPFDFEDVAIWQYRRFKSHIEGRHSPDLWEATAPFLSFKLALHIASRARVA